MKKTTIKTITTNLNISLAKSQESTAIFRACIQLAINEDSKLTYTTICESIPDFTKFSPKTIKNCMRFAKSITKDCKKLSIKDLIAFYIKEDTRKAYDSLVNGNRHKTQEASKQEASKQANRVQSNKSDVELYLDSLTLEELKQAYHIIRNKLGIKTSEDNIKMINSIKKIAC